MDEVSTETIHDLLLDLAGRVDDDLLAWARELVAVGETQHAFEVIGATLVADRAELPAAARAALVEVTRSVRTELDVDGALAPPHPADGSTPHRFDSAPAPDVVAAVRSLPARLLGGCRVLLTGRLTPAGSAPGPLPHPVVLVEVSAGARNRDVLAYQLADALDRAGVRASVEVIAADQQPPAYHVAALRQAQPVPPGGPGGPGRPRTDEPPATDRRPGTGPQPSPGAPSPEPAPRPVPLRAAEERTPAAVVRQHDRVEAVGAGAAAAGSVWVGPEAAAPEGSEATPAGSNQAGSDRAGSNQAGSNQAGSNWAGSDWAEAERAASEWAGVESIEADRAGIDGPGSDRSGSDGSGSDRPGTDRPGPEGPAFDGPGSGTSGSGGPRSDGPSSDEPGTGGSGSDRSGPGRPGSGGPGPDRPGFGGPGFDGPGFNGPSSDERGSEDAGSESVDPGHTGTPPAEQPFTAVAFEPVAAETRPGPRPIPADRAPRPTAVRVPPHRDPSSAVRLVPDGQADGAAEPGAEEHRSNPPERAPQPALAELPQRRRRDPADDTPGSRERAGEPEPAGERRHRYLIERDTAAGGSAAGPLPVRGESGNTEPLAIRTPLRRPTTGPADRSAPDRPTTAPESSTPGAPEGPAGAGGSAELGLRPESVARLSASGRELLARLQAELQGAPQLGPRSGGLSPNGNGTGPQARVDPPDLAG